MKLSIQNLCVRIFQFAQAFALAIVIVSTSATMSPAFAEEHTEDPCGRFDNDPDWKITYRLCRFFAGDTCRWARGRSPTDWHDIYRLCLPLAEQGDAEEQITVGYIYWSDYVAPGDPVEAVRWFRKAAEQGNQRGQERLGGAYYDGRGVPKDWTKAVHWYRKALYQRDRNTKKLSFSFWACSNLSSIYRNGGFGVPKDYVQAYKYITLEALMTEAFGGIFSVDYRNRLASLEKLMTKQQIAEGKRLAAEFVKAMQ